MIERMESDESPEESPSPNGSNGRDGRGRFKAGNAGGPGNPHAARVAKMRSALLDAVKPEDMKAIISALVTEAKIGNVQASKLLLAYLIGDPVTVDRLAQQTEIGDRIFTVESF
jgi:hypothetical protein